MRSVVAIHCKGKRRAADCSRAI
jgi:hypothetical protein